MRIPSTDTIMASGLCAPREQAEHMNEPDPENIKASNYLLPNRSRPHMNHALLPRAFWNLVESGDSLLAANMIHPLCWGLEASMYGKALFAGFTGSCC
jgi:hypothetical protein